MSNGIDSSVRQVCEVPDARQADAKRPLRLEQGTLDDKPSQNVPGIVSMEPLDGAQWCCTIFDFGDGDIEVLGYQVEEKPKKTKKGERKKGQRDEMSMEDLERSTARAKRQMRHKVMMMKADRMLTLTTRECISDREEFIKTFQKFVRFCKSQFKFTYVCVLELQQRGAYHAHVALNRYYNVNVLRHLWKKAVGGDANVDITTPRKGYWNRTKIASYLAKYMLKDQDGQKMNAKRYMASTDIKPPRKIKFYMPIAWNVFHLLRVVTEKVTGAKVRRHWEGHIGNMPAIWLCSFG